MRRFAEGEQADRLAVGRRDERVWGGAVRRLLSYRERHPEPFHDVYHDDFNEAPMQVVRAIYARFAMTLAPEVEARMEERVRDNPERSHGSHHYTLEMFGLSPHSIEREFADYLHRFPRIRPG